MAGNRQLQVPFQEEFLYAVMGQDAVLISGSMEDYLCD